MEWRLSKAQKSIIDIDHKCSPIKVSFAYIHSNHRVANLVKEGFVKVQKANSNHEKWSKLLCQLQVWVWSRTAILCIGPIVLGTKNCRDEVWRLEEEDNDSNHLQSHKTSLGVLISTSTIAADNWCWCKNPTQNNRTGYWTLAILISSFSSWQHQNGLIWQAK